MTETKKVVGLGLDTDAGPGTTATHKLQNFRELSRFCNVRFITTSGELYFHAWLLTRCSKFFNETLTGKAEKFGETVDIPIDARYSADALNIVLNIIQDSVKPDSKPYNLHAVDDASIPTKEEVCAIMRQYDIDGWSNLLKHLQYNTGPICMDRVNRMRALSLNIITKDFAVNWALGEVELAGDIAGDLLQEICLLAKESTSPETLVLRPWILFENLDPKNADEKYINAIVYLILGASWELEEIKLIQLDKFNSAKLTGIVPAIWDAAAAELRDWDWYWEAITSASMKPGMEIYRRFLDHFVEEPAEEPIVKLLKDPSS